MGPARTALPSRPLNPMTGLFLSAWLVFPLLLLGVCGGSGLLVRRVSGGAVSGVLLLPVGFALTVAVCTLGTSMTWLAPYAGGLAVVVALVGLVLERSSLHVAGRRVSGVVLYPAIAAFVAFAVFAAPVLLTGTPSWTGFGRIVDTAFQMAFAQHLAEAGRSVPIGNSSFNETILGLTGNGYPGGAQATLGAMAGVIRTDVPWCYQAFQAWAAAMGALALYALLRRAVAQPLMCCVGAAVASQPNILYDYALQGGIKELTTASLILLVAALLVERLPGPRSLRSSLALAPAIAAAVAAFSYGVTPWLGLLLPAALVLSLLRPGGRMRTLASWGVLAIATLLLAIPSVISSIKLFGDLTTAVNGVVELGLGNLTAPIPEISSAGVWISNDYRFPLLAHASASHVFDALVIALAAIGVLYALRRRLWMVAAFGLATPIALTYWVAHGGPWIELKAYTITATMVLAMAFVGAGSLTSLARNRATIALKIAAWIGAIAVTGAVLYGNALTYHYISLAPAARYKQLAEIGERFAGVGPAFYPAFDEYAEYFLRKEHGYDLVKPPGLQVRAGAVNLPAGQFAYALDLNQLELSFVQRFPLLVITRSSIASRPPANFDLVDQTSEFQAWRRVRPASEVVLHLPLSGSPTERTHHFCRGLRASVRRAGAGSSVAYVPAGPRAELAPTDMTHPRYWRALGTEALRAYGAGAIEGSVQLGAGGTYEISMSGSVARPVTLYVDGHRAGSVANQERYPGQFLHFARLSLSAGTHRIRLSRGNAGVSPGSGDGPDTSSGVIGPLIFALDQPQNGRLMVVPGSDAGRVCTAHAGYQWIEVLAPGARAVS
jgi:hypothetical protein